jgi:hypothetical protein
MKNVKYELAKSAQDIEYLKAHPKEFEVDKQWYLVKQLVKPLATLTRAFGVDISCLMECCNLFLIHESEHLRNNKWEVVSRQAMERMRMQVNDRQKQIEKQAENNFIFPHNVEAAFDLESKDAFASNDTEDCNKNQASRAEAKKIKDELKKSQIKEEMKRAMVTPGGNRTLSSIFNARIQKIT